MEQDLQLETIGKYLSGNLSEAEETTLLAWVDADPANQELFAEMVQLWDLTETYEETEPIFQADTAIAWNKVQNRIAEPAVAPAPKVVSLPDRRNALRWMGIAASLLLLLSVGWWWSRSTGIYREVAVNTGKNERQELILPDKSKVWLNQNSKLEYAYRDGIRKVTLNGEAFFDVSKDAKHPFVISSGAVETTVLGTSFNVRAYPSEEKVEVTVKTGRVEVASTKAVKPQKVVLLPNDSGIFDAESQELEKTKTSIAKADSWKDGSVVYDQDTPLSEVLPTLERFYNIKVEVSNLAILNCPFKGRFGGVSEEEALEIITYMTTTKFSKTAEGYLISGKGCQ
jgi:ferric-dicitrate binding protein FerR (iron transport regulator)